MNLPKRPDQAFLWEKAGPLSIFVSREEPLFFGKGAMETVDERLKREATSYPSRVEREEGCFLFCLFFSSHFGRPRSRSLSSLSILYSFHLLYYPLFFTSLYILECTSKNRGCHNKSYFSSFTVKKESGIYYAITRFIPIVFRTSIRALYLPLSLLPLFIPIISR